MTNVGAAPSALPYIQSIMNPSNPREFCEPQNDFHIFLSPSVSLATCLSASLRNFSFGLLQFSLGCLPSASTNFNLPFQVSQSGF